MRVAIVAFPGLRRRTSSELPSYLWPRLLRTNSLTFSSEVTGRRSKVSQVSVVTQPLPVTPLAGGEHVPKKSVDLNTVTKQRQSVALEIFCMFTVPVLLLAS